jgi:hypothetical protein
MSFRKNISHDKATGLWLVEYRESEKWATRHFTTRDKARDFYRSISGRKNALEPAAEEPSCAPSSP